MVLAAILETLGSILATLGAILVTMGSPGALLEALGAQRRPDEKQTRKKELFSLQKGHHFETFSVKNGGKRDF